MKTKLMQARKERNLTQKEMADMLCISQSQYQRREMGEIRIIDEEWLRIAQVLNKNVEEIREDENVVNQYFDNVSGNYIGSHNNYCNVPEFVLEHQQEYIEMLKAKIAALEAEIENLCNSH